MKIEKYFVVLSNFEIEEYMSLEHALNKEDKLFIAIQQRDMDTTTQKNKFSLQFVNNGETKQENQIKINRWSAFVSVMLDSDKGNYNPVFKFCAPNGLIKDISYKRERGINSVVSAVKMLFEIKHFNSWQDFELAEENKRLKVENEALITKVTKLENEIASKILIL